MRLPALTDFQRRNEDSREIHERLWAMVQTGGRLRLPATEETIATRAIWRQQGTLHRFWASRGYVMKSKLTKDRTALEMWLVPRVERKAAA